MRCELKSSVWAALIWYGAAIALFVLCFAAVLFGGRAFGAVDLLNLGRIQIIENDEIAFDTKLEPVLPRGTAQIVSDYNWTIQSMEFDAWLWESDEFPFVRDTWVAVDYAPNGAFYNFFSLVRNEVIRTTFLRRAPPFDTDPATIFYFPLDDGRLMILDYRYPKEE